MISFHYAERIAAENEDILKLASLEEIFYYDGDVPEFDLRPLKNLKVFYVQCNRPVNKVDLSGLKMMKSIYLDFEYSYSPLHELNIDGCVNLQEIHLYGTDFEELDLSECTELKTLIIRHGTIKNLNLTGVNKLKTFWCNYNKLEKLDISSMTKLTQFRCEFNNITELIIPHGNNFYEFVCNNNYLDTSPDSQFMKDMEEVSQNLKWNPSEDAFVYLPQNVKETLPIELDKEFLAMSVGDTYSVTAECDALLGENPELQWTSSNPEAVTVDESGNITALGSGTAHITARLKNTPDISDEVLIRVFAPETDGDGSGDDPYVLRTKDDIVFLSGITRNGEISTIRKFLDADYVLKPENGEYIDMAGVDFVPIGFGYPLSRGGYRGIFDGNDKVIKNLTINMTYNAAPLGIIYSTGFFAGLGGATVKNITFENARINVQTPSDCEYLPDVGIVSGELICAEGSNYIINTTVFGSINVEGKVDSVGGICGFGGTDVIRSCAVDADIYAPEAKRCGGIVGGQCHVQNSYSIGDIEGGNSVGGIFGDYCYATGCYSFGSVRGKENVGGIAGHLNKGYNGYIKNCFSRAEVTGESNVGGIVGLAEMTDETALYNNYRLEGQIVNGATNTLGDELTIQQLYSENVFNSILTYSFWGKGSEYNVENINYNPKINKYDKKPVTT